VNALSVNVSVPVADPIAAGENVTPTAQLAPAAMLAPHVLLAMAKFPLATILANASATFWRFVTVTDFTELVLPIATVPKLRLLEENVTGALPVPERPTACGLVRALSVNVSVPAADPMAAGVKVTPTLQFAPAARLAPHVVLAIAKLPLATMLAKLSGTLRRFVTVTLLTALVLPIATVPKFRLLDENVTGALPVPASVTVWVPASSTIVIVPAAAPSEVGVNDTEIVHDAPGTMVAVHVFV